jgi:hypothetical protein
MIKKMLRPEKMAFPLLWLSQEDTENEYQVVGLLLWLPDYEVQKPLELLSGRAWKHLNMQGREALKCCTQCLIDDSCGSSEDQNAQRNADSKDCPYKVSDGNEDFIGNWTVTFWQSTCLHFACTPWLCGRLSLKEMD